MPATLTDYLCCPIDHGALERSAAWLVCGQGHRYPVVSGVPVMLVKDADATLWVSTASREAAERNCDGTGTDPFFIETLGLDPYERERIRKDLANPSAGPIDPVVQHIVGATNGNLYRPGSFTSYPIPEIPLPAGNGGLLLDIGCNWGRWCHAAARRGYRPVGIDPSLGAVLAAQRICRHAGVDADFVVADARRLPFRDATFAVVFSYSVLQHFSKENAAAALSQAARVLEPGGSSWIQMPNTYGIRCLYHQLRRGFHQPGGFEVRYWTPSELQRVFAGIVGPTSLSVDGYFGLGVRPGDRHLLPAKSRLVIDCSEFLKRLARSAGFVTYVADSLWVTSVRPSHAMNPVRPAVPCLT